MIVADASAILAIVLGEEDASLLEEALATAAGALMSPVNYWEVLVRSRAEFSQAGVETAEAIARYRGRPGGRLDMGDCFAYALAAREGDGLLYKGSDFPRTEVESALAKGR